MNRTISSVDWKHEIADKLRMQIETCTKCDLYQTRTKPVPGEGCLDTDIMFVGEGPGKNEDLQGIPFVGQAGKILDELLIRIGLNRDLIFIGNTVKCRPPGNRTPTSFEIETCKPFLVSQIEIIQPQIIVIMGSAALTSLLGPGRSISKDRGISIEKDGILYFPTYHPAAALYRRKILETIQVDFDYIGRILEKRKSNNEDKD
jgi:uracil-DNA glycosylase